MLLVSSKSVSLQLRWLHHWKVAHIRAFGRVPVGAKSQRVLENDLLSVSSTRHLAAEKSSVDDSISRASSSTSMAEGGDGEAWFVLCGGEAEEMVGELQHTSIVYLGRAYEQLRSAGVSRERIIVIGQLEEYRTFLRAGLPGIIPEAVFRHQLEATEEACRRLIAEGGADYDGRDVHPATLRRVLLGIGPGRVVSPEAGSLFFGLYSHGDKHPSVPGVESEDPMKNEWFAHFPYPTPAEEQHELYSYVATAAAKELKGRNRPTYYLYGSTLRAIFAQLFHSNPHRPIVGLLNYCLSGGNLAFMKNEAARRLYGADEWPLLLMSSAQAGREALVSGLWTTWWRGLAQAIASPGSGSLGDVFSEAEAAYYRENVYELKNHITYRCNVHERYQIMFHADLDHALTAASGGRPDLCLIRQLQHNYREGKRYRGRGKGFGVSVLICGWGGHEVDLVEVVQYALRQIAMPECVHGGMPGGERPVLELNVRALVTQCINTSRSAL